MATATAQSSASDATPPGTTTQSSGLSVASPVRANLRQAFKLAISLVLFYWFALSVNWDLPNYGALAIVLVSLDTRGASLQKGLARVIGTTAGVVIGFLILSLFHYDRWSTMLAFVGYLILVGYFMQGSRYSYAWFVAAFVPLVIWGDNYPQFDNAFYFGTFRWLETTMGVVIYTLVDLLLWPQRAGEQFLTKGRQLWVDARKTLAHYESRGRGTLPPAKSGFPTTKSADSLAQAAVNLRQAFLDTPAISRQKERWQRWQAETEAMFSAMEMARESINDCRDLEVERIVPNLKPAIQTFKHRVDHIDTHWQLLSAADGCGGEDDGDDRLLTKLDIEPSAKEFDGLTHSQRAALCCFLAHLAAIDRSSRNVLDLVRQLAGKQPDLNQPDEMTDDGQSPYLIFEPTPWDRRRWMHALFPATAFVAAFLFWIFVNPPTGAKVPMVAGIFSLLTLRTPMNPIPLVVVLGLSIFLAVAPVYWFIMPSLSTGGGLLALVFGYALLFAYLGGSRPALKAGPMVMFVNMVGISNEQKYSFQGPVDGALMMVMGVACVALVYLCYTPLRPERALMLWVERFFRGSARFVAALDGDNRQSPGPQATRAHCLQSMVMPAPGKIQANLHRLEPAWFPEDLTKNIECLHDNLQRVSFRLQSLENALRQAGPDTTETPAHIRQKLRQWGATIEVLLGEWSRPTSLEAGEKQDVSLSKLANEIRMSIDELSVDSRADLLRDTLWAGRYAIIGNLRALIDALRETQVLLYRVDWQRLSAARF